MSPLADRVRWSKAILARELSRGRSAGYLVGPPIADPDVEMIAAELRATDSVTRSPMHAMRKAFGLSKVEVDVLWLLACCEIDSGLIRLAMSIAAPGSHGLAVHDVAGIFGVGMHTLDRLAAYAIIEIGQGEQRHHRHVRASDRIVDILRGFHASEARLAGIASLQQPDATFAVPASFARAASASDEDLLVVAIGPNGDRDLAIRAACARPVFEVDCAQLADHPELLERQLRCAVRDAMLADAVVFFAGCDRIAALPVFSRILELVRGPVLASMSQLVECRAVAARRLVLHHVAKPNSMERQVEWALALPSGALLIAEQCAERYRLPIAMIREVARSLDAMPPDIGGIRIALRDRLDRRLAGFARRVAGTQQWADLVLPDDQVELLHELVARIRHGATVLDTWGFADKIGKGRGVSALFSGPPGTGKTMIAGLIADELDMDLYQVDLSKIVSKYIGETEKQLAALFDAAEYGQAMILFDEADALFGKRTEVKSSNDRYANLETNYLLQRLEAFDGVCILTTNHVNAIDEAFLRRLSLHVRVPMPDQDHRVRLWSAMLPDAAAVGADLDFGDLAREYPMSGGYIKNAVVRAAFLAANETSAITQEHFERGARAEYEAMGKIVHVQARVAR
jgi:hypothetical protein